LKSLDVIIYNLPLPLPLRMSAATAVTTYYGPRGYTLLKECMDAEDLKLLRDELTVGAYVPKAPVQPPKFPIYRECSKKIYIPRFYGTKIYGFPEESRIPPGTPVSESLVFAGEMREYQNVIVDKYIHQVTKPENQGMGGGGLLDVDPGKGKTVMALNVIARLRVKTLVVVHKSFLLNQWIERIQQFLPAARVGMIQGQILDIDDKDIVIGMLQSLSMKEYPRDMFDTFGLTVYDECHHMSAEVFCRCMMKIVTKYTLGLSGTMVRKDGLTKVFKHFLGDVVHKEKNDTTSHAVIVKGIQYKVDDAEFNLTEYDYRGNPKFSTMISKVCNYNRRSEFVLDVLQNELATNPDQQVMILAHNRSLLEYFHDAIEHRKIATVGYYVGGMKEAALKLSESKKVIIATYAMASEGLDIKTLTTLIMASPKTDVCQSVGRILRVKHSSPLVIDIIDPQDVFRAQWLKRQTYYIKQRYRIIMTDTDGYYKNNWTVKYQPPVVTAKKTARDLELADADIIEIDEETGDLSVTTETSAKSKLKSTIPKTNGKCLIQLVE
jgi:superfamily II DNA or RNA helicase